MGRYTAVDKTIRSAPLAVVPIVSPMFTGNIKALCIEDPLCEVIIGNLPEVVKQKNDILNREKNLYKNLDGLMVDLDAQIL